MAKKKRKPTGQSNGMKLLLLALAGVLIIAGALFFIKKATAPTIAPDSNRAVLQKLQKQLSLTAAMQPYNYMDWVGENKQLYPLRGEYFIVGTVNSNGIAKYEGLTSEDLASITFTQLAPLRNAAETFFLENGFEKSTLNSRITGESPGRVQRVGFFKGDMKCMITAYEFTDPFANFFCGKIDNKQISLQLPFRDLFEYKYNPSSLASFRVDKVDGDFATGSKTFDYSGYQWIAQKKNDTWEIVWKGQEIPLCSDMKKYEIPKEIYQQCYTPK